MRYSIAKFDEVNKSEIIFASDFYSNIKRKALNQLKKQQIGSLIDYFVINKNIINTINKEAINYDLKHSIGNFLNNDNKIERLDKQKILLEADSFIISRLRSYLKEFAIVRENNLLQVASTEYLSYKSKDNEKFSTSLLLALTMTKQVQTILNYSQYGTEHPRFYEFVFNTLPISTKVLNLNNEISKIVTKALILYDNSKLLYKLAEDILLKELDLVDCKPKHQLSYIKKFSDTKISGRIDAEHFQPKYDEIIKKIKGYKNGYNIISNLFNNQEKIFRKQQDTVYNYVEIGCINIYDTIIEPLCIKGIDLPVNAKYILNKEDLLISQVRPYRGAISIIKEDNLIGSAAFTVLSEKDKLNKETLLVLLRTKYMLDFSLKFNTGISYPTINPEDILSFPIPIIRNEIQISIKKQIDDMYKLKKQSKQLLEIAKLGVEKAIEKDDEISITWINQELEKLDIKL